MKLENSPPKDQTINVIDINADNPKLWKKLWYIVRIVVNITLRYLANWAGMNSTVEKINNRIKILRSKIEVPHKYSTLSTEVRKYINTKEQKQKSIHGLLEGLESANTADEVIEILNNPYNIYLIQENGFIKDAFLSAFKNIVDLGEDIFEIISNDHEITVKNNKIKASELRSFIKDSDLFEPIIKLCATKRRLDISDCINKLSKEQLLRLKKKESLNDLCNIAKEVTPDSVIDKNHFTSLFNEILTMPHIKKIEIAKLTYSNLIDINTLYTDKKYKDGNNILMFFIENNDVAGIQELIELYKKSSNIKKISFNETDNNGEFALFKAAKLGNPEVLNKLIELNNILPEKNKLDVNKRISKKKYTALHTAIRYDKHEFIKILLDNFQDINIEATTDEKTTPLIFATLYSPKSLETLVKYGADVNAIDIYDKTAIFYAAKTGNLQVLDALKDADVNIMGHDDDTPLHAAMHARSTNFITYLKKYNKKFQNINKKNIIGYSPLRLAVEMRKHEMIKALAVLNLNIDFDLKDNDNKTLFEIAEKKDAIYQAKITEALNYLQNSTDDTKKAISSPV